MKRALVTFALTRTLNGVISVAQGTQLAFEPAGVGVVISAGEILDPLNDLVEQFSWLTLLAATSLGVQIMLGEMFATTAVNVALSVVVVLGHRCAVVAADAIGGVRGRPCCASLPRCCSCASPSSSRRSAPDSSTNIS